MKTQVTKLNKYKASLNFLQRKFLVRFFKIHILYLGAGEIMLKLNKHKASLNFLQCKFLVWIFKIHILKLGVRGGSPGRNTTETE